MCSLLLTIEWLTSVQQVYLPPTSDSLSYRQLDVDLLELNGSWLFKGISVSVQSCLSLYSTSIVSGHWSTPGSMFQGWQEWQLNYHSFPQNALINWSNGSKLIDFCLHLQRNMLYVSHMNKTGSISKINTIQHPPDVPIHLVVQCWRPPQLQSGHTNTQLNDSCCYCFYVSLLGYE